MKKTVFADEKNPTRKNDMKFLLLSLISYSFFLITLIMISSLIIYLFYSLNPESINNWIIPENKYYMQPGTLIGIYFFLLAFLALIINIVYSYHLYRNYRTDFSINLFRGFAPSYLLSIGLILSSAIFYSIIDFQNGNKINQLAVDFKPELEQAKDLNNFERSILRGQAIAGNANEVYKQILDRKKEFKVNAKDVEKIKVGRYLVKADPSVTNKYEKEIKLVRNATTYNRVNFNLEPSFVSPLPNYISAQNLTRVMTSRAVELYQNNSAMEGAEMILDTIRFGQDLGNSGPLISGMVGIVIDKIAINNLSAQLGKQKLSQSEFHNLLNQIEKLMGSEIELKKAFIFENLALKNELLKLESEKNDYSELFSALALDNEPWLLSNKLLMKPQIRDAIKKLDQLQPIISEIINTNSYNPELDNEKLEKMNDIMKSNYILYYAIQSYKIVFERIKDNKAYLRGLYIHMALQAYFNINKKYPERLAELSPSIIKKLPTDPFSEKEFLYNLNNNQYSLYSSGKDLKDDRADMKNDLVIYPVKDVNI